MIFTLLNAENSHGRMLNCIKIEISICTTYTKYA